MSNADTFADDVQTPLTESLADFARRRGWSRARVSQLKAEGRIVLDDGGRVLVEETQALLAATLDPTKAHRDRQLAAGGESRDEAAGGSNETPPAAGSQIKHTSDYWEARARRETVEADRAELALRKQQEELTDANAVKAARYATAQRVVNALVQLPARLAPIIAPTDPQRAERVLLEEIRKALREVAEDLESEARAADDAG